MIFSELFGANKDIYLASYPRSGNTWIRVLLGFLYFKDASINSLIDLQQYIPDEHYTGSTKYKKYKIDNAFQIVKTHNQFNAKKYKKAIYMYRNPLDVAWSYYNFLADTKAIDPTNVQLFVENFLDGKIGFGCWEDNVRSWIGRKQVLVLAYEDIVKEPAENIKKICHFIGVLKSEDEVITAMNKATPLVVKKITDDEAFYGVNKPNFVRSPMNSDREKKQEFMDRYTELFKERIKLYDFDAKRLIQ
jgi:hypothetical protein